MKYYTALFLALLPLLISACQSNVCPSGSVTHSAALTPFPTLPPPSNVGLPPAPSLVEIGGKMIEVDRVIHGPLCNDRWSGTIYVACDVQVATWTDEENPTFLSGCDFTVEPGTIVYVAAHNDTTYYNGCSCHTGGESK